MQDTQTYLGLLHERGKKGLPLKRVYRQLFNKHLYLTAYGRIYRNKGAMTPGVTEETVDAMSLEKIDAIIHLVRAERYQWQPARRTYIPKKDGRKRPLGLPTWSDKLLAEVIRLILDAYYDGQFSDRSHGFRSGRGCHTALRDIYSTWGGTVWLIEGDISQCFTALDHDLLLSTLKAQIHDGRFIHLIQKLLDAGYLEDWKFNRTFSGVPQGSIVSPVLSNILLDKLDKYVETVLIPRYTTGDKKKRNAEYETLRHQARALLKQGQVNAAQLLRKRSQQMPSLAPHDPDYRRLRYCRYADDFLLGFTGPKQEAEEIKQHLATFLRDELKLELSEAKTLITHARTQTARFLGYDVTTIQDNAKRSPFKGTMRRSINGHIGLRVPHVVLQEKCKRYKRKGKAVHRTELTNESDYTIITTYQLEYRGIVNYYRMAYNLHTLQQLKWVMDTSLTKTLAHKHKCSVAQVYDRYKADLNVKGIQYKGLQATIYREGKKPLIATWGGIPLTWDSKATLEDHPFPLWGKRAELEQRLLAQVCEYCGATALTDHIEVHHIRALKDLNAYTGRDKPGWVKVMAARKRKTLVLCRTCHMDIQYGRPVRRHTIKLMNAKPTITG